MISHFLIAWALLAAVFTIVWALCLRLRNYSFLDAAWGYGIGLIAPLYAILASGWAPRRLAFTVAGGLWSLRLGTAIFKRVLRHHPSEDVRYATLRERWPGPSVFWLFFQIQALTVLVLTWPFLVAAHHSTPAWCPAEICGLLIVLIGIGGEAWADAQLAAFKKSAPPKAVCQSGLWAYSRHPNYFFEFLVWCGFSLAVFFMPWGWLALVCPCMMLYFLLRVTGIPLTEAHAVESKGDAYRLYQRQVSAFIPWTRKNVS